MSDTALRTAAFGSATQPSDQMLWAADLLASYGAALPEPVKEDNEDEAAEDTPVVETVSLEVVDAPEPQPEPVMPEDEGVFEMLFGWIIDWLEGIFGGEADDPVAENPEPEGPTSPPANVAEDLVLIPLIPEDDFDDGVDEDTDDLDALLV